MSKSCFSPLIIVTSSTTQQLNPYEWTFARFCFWNGVFKDIFLNTPLEFITLIGKACLTSIQRPRSVLPLVPMVLPRKLQVIWSWIAPTGVGIPCAPKLTTVRPKAPWIRVSWKFSGRANNREIKPRVFMRNFNYRLCMYLRVTGYARSQKCFKN